jgi:hypothetical protein
MQDDVIETVIDRIHAELVGATEEPGTVVIFRRFSDGDVVAIMPEIPGTSDAATCSSYMHVGQHGACAVDLISDLEPAPPGEYAPLLEELRRIGYRPAVRDRNHPRYTARRLAELLRTRS